MQGIKFMDYPRLEIIVNDAYQTAFNQTILGLKADIILE